MSTADEDAIRTLVGKWAQAVRTRDIAGILAHHSPDILMFDVPPPFVSKGLDAYRNTWICSTPRQKSQRSLPLTAWTSPQATMWRL